MLLQILKNGGFISLIDIEGDGENSSTITLADVHSKVQQAHTEALLEMINETDDADTSDIIIQQVFYNEIIFG